MEYHNENFNGQYDFRSRFHRGYHVPLHLHEYSELFYCKSGSGSVVIHGKRMQLQEGELIWLPPNYVHQYDFDDAEVICTVFSNDLIPLFFKTLGERYFCVCAVPMGELSEMVECLPTLSKGNLLQVVGYLNLICARVMERADFEESRPTDGVLYQRVISYLSEHYMENLTLTQVAKEFGYNVKYLSHALHDLTGIHFRRLLNFYRINRAKQLLETKRNMNIATVASESGFGALNTFNREFKSVVGMTPHAYRDFFAK